MHPGHQSEPVKSASTGCPPFPAFSSALFQSVSQEEDAEQIKAEAKERTPIAGKNEFLILTVL
jgi:hypothetical protein